MTDAPNFGTKFGRRKPCLRYIGPLLRITSVAPVGRGDLTPPRTPPLLCRGRAPSRPAGEGIVPRQFPLVPKRLPHRVGADLCVRPNTLPRGTRARADTQAGPYRFNCSLHQPLKTGRGQSPAPTVGEHPTPLRDLPGHPKPRLPQPKTPCMTAGTPSPVPTQKTPPSVSEQGFPKGGLAPFGRFKGVPGGKQGSRRKPAQRLRWEKEEQRNE